MPILKIFAASFMVALSGAMMPGPLLTVTVSQTVRRGFIASVLLMIGHALLELVLVAGLIFGLGGVLKNN
ncbi:MAG TPA: LysE family transporter, partial [Armatimonadota bacterium]